MTTVHEQVTRYAVSVFPDGHELRRHFTITVEYRGAGRWAVLYEGSVIGLGADGTWAPSEPLPSSRTDEWLARYRFASAEDALVVARHWAPLIRCNGRTAEQAAAWMAQQT
jgi:hypothetical protein